MPGDFVKQNKEKIIALIKEKGFQVAVNFLVQRGKYDRFKALAIVKKLLESLKQGNGNKFNSEDDED